MGFIYFVRIKQNIKKKKKKSLTWVKTERKVRTKRRIERNEIIGR